MDPTIPPEVAEHIIAAAAIMRPHLNHLTQKEARHRFAELAKLYYPETTNHLRAV